MVHETHLIYGKRVILRPYEAGFSEEELARMYRWSRDKSVLRWSGGSPLLMSFEDFKVAFQEELQHPNRHRRFFGLLTTDGELIGRLGYYNINHKYREAELGIVIGEKAYWGQGYGTDAIQTLLRYIFEETNLTRIYLNTYAENLRAQRSFQKCGFRVVGRNRRLSLARGPHDEIKMEIYRDEWLANQPRNPLTRLIKGDRS